MGNRKRTTADEGRRRARGQALVEFALVFLIFVTILTGVIEFGIGFSVKMQISFASRDAAVVASESGGTPSNADGAILNTIDKDITPPATRNLIDHVDIFWANSDGSVKNGAIQRYTPGGPLYLGWGGWTNTVSSYPGSSRCAFIGGTAAGCLALHTGPDTVGVSIVYKYSWMTPLPSLIGLTGAGFTFTQTNLTTMEPIPAI
ncbi:MAG: TadE/TadG family type IV pilus assembly protein [Candidatus Limnocylindrales bacterium]|jgi:hypothetical protein